MKNTKKVLTIGIDPGIKTGMAIYDCDKKRIIFCETLPIHRAFTEIMSLYKKETFMMVVVEDARLRKWYGSGNNKGKQQGAGAIKIQCSQWQAFLEDMLKAGIIDAYRMIHPMKGGTKIDANLFRKMTGYERRTSEHSRDAGIIAWSYGQSYRHDTLQNLLES